VSKHSAESAERSCAEMTDGGMAEGVKGKSGVVDGPSGLGETGWTWVAGWRTG
jgi:hypothetical protein